MNPDYSVISKDLQLYINKFVDDVQIHNKVLFGDIKPAFLTCGKTHIKHKMAEVFMELSKFGPLLKRFKYPLCQCILHGILTEKLSLFSISSNAFSEDGRTLKPKPQYAIIGQIYSRLREMGERLEISTEYHNILPDINTKYPLPEFDSLWNANKEYIEQLSGQPCLRMSTLRSQYFPDCQGKLQRLLNDGAIESTICKYENNVMMRASYKVPESFVRRQIPTYIETGIVLETILPYAVLIDVQKKHFPYEQPFYNYLRTNKLPIIAIWY